MDDLIFAAFCFFKIATAFRPWTIMTGKQALAKNLIMFLMLFQSKFNTKLTCRHQFVKQAGIVLRH